MKVINELYKPIKRPIKVLQFGEGNFLRAFSDYYIQKMNEHNNFNGNVAIIKSIKYGCIDKFLEQENLYTVFLRGKCYNKIVNEKKVINSIEKTIDIFKDYKSYIQLAQLDSLEYIVSNTTEAGIEFNSNDKYSDKLNITFPAKLTQFLYERYKHNKGGLYIIACELIDNNATKLAKCVDKYIKLWSLPKEFKNWNDKNNSYCNSLVDRIVSGYPKDNLEMILNDLGYKDDLVTVAEPFGLWVIENQNELDNKLKTDNLDKILFVNDVNSYKTRKVRLLNGTHTSMVPVAYLSGLSTVGESFENNIVSSFIKKMLYDEIIPTVNLSRNELVEFADSIIERFENPYVKHYLLSIALNSISKWRVRVLPSLKGYIYKYNAVPKRLAFSLACLIKMYSGHMINNKYKCIWLGREYELNDELTILEYFDSLNKNDMKVTNVLSNENLWGENLAEYNGLDSLVNSYYNKLNVQSFDEVQQIIEELNE